MPKSFENGCKTFRRPVSPSNAEYLWFDAVTLNQHKSKSTPNLQCLKEAIGKIGHTMLILLPWRDPIQLRRSWCLWEINATIETTATLEVVLSKSQEEDFIDTLLDDYDKLINYK